MRRQLDLRVEDFVRASARIADRRVCTMVAEMWKKGIMDEIRAVSLDFECGSSSEECSAELTKEWDVEGIAMTLSLSRAEQDGREE